MKFSAGNLSDQNAVRVLPSLLRRLRRGLSGLLRLAQHEDIRPAPFLLGLNGAAKGGGASH